MGRTIECPSCSAPNELLNPGITMFSCTSCRTLVYAAADGQVRTGERSVLPESDSRLFLGATGAVAGHRFGVVGHVRYDYGQGRWDEWYLSLASGGEGWFSEDERRLTRSERLGPEVPLPTLRELRVGAQVPIRGALFVVREIGEATCVGAEGQLPFAHLPGERYAYADLVSMDGTQFGTLEYDAGERPTGFVGVVVQHDELALDGGGRPVRLDRAPAGKSIQCRSCTAPLETPPRPDVETLVCSYCGALLDLTSAEQRVLGRNEPGFQHGFQFEIGDAGELHGRRYEVCGRMFYADPEGYVTREYLLFHPESGYLWLAEEANHYVLYRPTTAAPSADPRYAAQRSWVRVGTTQYQVYEQGSVTLRYVDGALPWIAHVGDTTQYCDCVAPPKVFGVEYGASEIEFFEGEYVPAEVVWRAFGKPGRPPTPYGVHGGQAFTTGRGTKLVAAVAALYGLANVALCGWSLGGTESVVYQQRFDATQYTEETVSEPFVLPQASILGVSIDAPVDNSWLAVQMALVDSTDSVVAEVDGDVAYYYGYEDGESWTEGSRNTTVYFRAPPPGEYRLLVQGEGGSGEAGPPGGEPLEVRLLTGVRLSRYFFGIALGCFLLPVLLFLRRGMREHTRWSAVTDDDDDDGPDFDFD